jgi:hypothetical protein
MSDGLSDFLVQLAGYRPWLLSWVDGSEKETPI